MNAAFRRAPAAGRSGSPEWASLVAIVFAIVAALSCAVDQLVTLSPDHEAGAATTSDR